MKIANKLPQNSKEWLAWRKSGLGASDAPIVMGVSPFTSRFELWLEKTGLGERKDFHPRAIEAMTRGKLLESKAREAYEKLVGFKVDADVNIIHDTRDEFRASLDGYSAEHNIIVEIKCPGKADLAEAAKGRVPKKYTPQVQMQLWLSGAKRCDYFTFDGEKGTIVEVTPDVAYHQKLEQELGSFWALVQSQTPPELDITDIVAMSDIVGTLSEKIEKASKALTLSVDVYKMQQKSNK
jgi:putative phage-type endonuclease